MTNKLFFFVYYAFKHNQLSELRNCEKSHINMHIVFVILIVKKICYRSSTNILQTQIFQTKKHSTHIYTLTINIITLYIIVT